MQISWLEYKNKKSGVIIKKTAFEKLNVMISDTPEASIYLLDVLKNLRGFALGIDQGQFSDVICRTNFAVAHQEFLWFAKNTCSQGSIFSSENTQIGPIVIVDEEELYDQDSKMLMRRGFKEITVDGYDTHLPLINDEKSMIHLFKSLPVAEQVTTGFSHIYSYTLTDDNQTSILEQISQLAHGMVVLLYGDQLTTPLDLQPLHEQRQDLQIFATNCIAQRLTKVIQKGTTISCKTIDA